jgi:serine/threonine-protein kinase
MIQVLSGLIAAHDKAIIHRDIKPENVFLARRVGCPPIVKILDFGVSKMTAGFGGGDEQLDLTRTGMVMGTPYYMSPEQARGERNLDGRVDVYACGVMMYEALAGKRPFLAPNYNALLLAIINSNPVALRDIRPATPSALEAIVARAMAKSRDERYPSARHLLHDLQGLNLSRSGGNAAVRVPPPPTAEERARAPVIGGRASRREPPSATLRSRMSAPRESQEPATRLDIRAGRVPKGAESSGSIDISIDLNTETPVVDPRGRAPGGSDYVDEMPTEIFRPGMRVKAPAASRSEPAPRRNLAALVGDDWEGETVVHQPKPMLPPKQRRFNADETVVLHREGDPNETPLVRPRRPR